MHSSSMFLRVLLWFYELLGMDSTSKKSLPYRWCLRNFNRDVERAIRRSFPQERQNDILRLMDEFNPDGKEWILLFLEKAKDSGKLERALEVLWKSYKSYWEELPIGIRGTLIGQSFNQFEFNRIHRILGFETPEIVARVE